MSGSVWQMSDPPWSGFDPYIEFAREYGQLERPTELFIENAKRAVESTGGYWSPDALHGPAFVAVARPEEWSPVWLPGRGEQYDFCSAHSALDGLISSLARASASEIGPNALAVLKRTMGVLVGAVVRERVRAAAAAGDGRAMLPTPPGRAKPKAIAGPVSAALVDRVRKALSVVGRDATQARIVGELRRGRGGVRTDTLKQVLDLLREKGEYRGPARKRKRQR